MFIWHRRSENSVAATIQNSGVKFCLFPEVRGLPFHNNPPVSLPYSPILLQFLMKTLRVSACGCFLLIWFVFKVTIFAFLRSEVKRTLCQHYCPYFSTEVMVNINENCQGTFFDAH